MFRISKVCLFGAMALALTLSCTALAGQKHQAYLRTMDDLRLARALLQRTNQAQNVNGSEDEVMEEINKVIGADRKKPHDLPRIDARIQWAERLSESLRLIEMARQDCSKEKDNSGDSGLQARVFNLLDQAHTRITVAIETKNFDYSARDLPTRND
jgi:hypothetical protein